MAKEITIRTLKQKIGTSKFSKVEKENATSTLYHRREDGSYTAVEIKGIVSELNEDYLYISVLSPISILGRMDGEKTVTITGTDERAVKKAAKDLEETLEGPKAARAKAGVKEVPADLLKIYDKVEAKAKEIEIPENHELRYDPITGKPGFVKIRRKKAKAPTEEPVAA
ncbi:MAG: hypothetical protein EON58_06595 [Alphaproteobacteria bacterium]|nr:MAG: hypothetical protein EON58_06595 [Alphaproteobacteria bacterium]